MGYLTNKTLFYKSYNILIILKVVVKHLVETILLQDHIKLMMVVISFTRYTNPKETFLILMVMMCIRCYINVINILI